MRQEQDRVAWKGEWHTSVPDGLLHAQMSGLAKFMWICLKSFASKTSPHPFPGRHTVCKMMDIGVNSFKKYRKELELNGWLERMDRRNQNGDYAGNIYTLMVPENCKQEQPPGSKIWPPIKWPPKHWAAIDRPRKDYPILNEYQEKRNTTTTRAACAAESDGGDFLPASRASESGENTEAFRAASYFLDRWQWGHTKWFGRRYHLKPGHSQLAEEVLGELGCKGKHLAAYAFRMWINTAQADHTVEKGYDPLFWQIKASRNVQFFLKYIDKIANEMKYPLDANLTALSLDEYNALEQTVGAGRPEPE